MAGKASLPFFTRSRELIVRAAAVPGRCARLLRGEILRSLLCHPLVPYLTVSVPGLALWYIWCRKKKKPIQTEGLAKSAFCRDFSADGQFSCEKLFSVVYGPGICWLSIEPRAAFFV